MMGYKLHPRESICSKAALDISEAITDAAEKYDLSAVEISQILAEKVTHWLVYPLRRERHTQFGRDKRAGLQCDAKKCKCHEGGE